MRLADIAQGDVLTYWHDSGAFGASLCYARVIRLGKVKVLVRGEVGEEGWHYPDFFDHKVDAETVKQLQSEGVTI